MTETGGGQILILSFISFCISVIAAVIAIDMYRLLRTGQFGASWRVLIIASVMFALLHALRFGEHFDFTPWTTFHLSDVVEFVFVIALAYAFFLQRQTFKGSGRL